ncbi:DoxX family membrane protein [Umezawaea tangerina]|uniref:DoxX-like protein n=1 Tax=Umezawaea tangerina TaxID=84725 RepID=A0A2T0SZG3_9PSEU|nr:DoxX family membrane protein [Umezawaea tangerina]PRY38812.1 DoxX-like protein [Umezawaea tangerina]
MTTTTAQRTATTSAAAPLTRHLPTAGRVVLGLLFVVMGLNGFLNFLPQPEGAAMPAEALAFSMALAQTGYMMQMTMGVQVLCGILLLANRFVPLALVLLAPVVVNIVAFHLFLEQGGLPIAVAVAAIELGLAWTHRAAFRSVLRATSA